MVFDYYHYYTDVGVAAIITNIYVLSTVPSTSLASLTLTAAKVVVIKCI